MFTLIFPLTKSSATSLNTIIIIGVRVKTPFVTAPGLQILVIFTLTPNIGGAAQRSGASHTNDLLEGIIAQVPPVLYELTEQQFRIHLVVAHQCIVLL